MNEYKKSLGKPTQLSAAGEATYNLFPIARTAYRPFDSTPYLPGSSIKGSIRTAWLNRCNAGKPLTPDERRDHKGAPRHLQERLLGYQSGKFENDPFRHVAIADAHPEDDTASPPTRVIYAISKKKRQPRDGESHPPELKVFLETIPEALPSAFLSEIRLAGKISWNALCDACNTFYAPQLKAELTHPVLGALLETKWKQLVGEILDNEICILIAARQGFLLRVGRHSGAESVTLDGLRNIKILGPKVNGKPTFDYRHNTTEKRFASETKAGDEKLLPFGWVWVDASNDEYRYYSDTLRQKLAKRSVALRDAHRDRCLRLEEVQHKRTIANAEAAQRKQALEIAAREAEEARLAHQAALALLSPRLQAIENFIAIGEDRAVSLMANKERLNGDYHNRARKLAADALTGTDWTADEKLALANAITEWLPKIVEKIDKGQLKNLKLSALRGS